ncbi:MAG: glycosyltransferase [Gemmatimonadota bacterium]
MSIIPFLAADESREAVASKPFPAAKVSDVYVSIVVPTWNGGARLPETLRSIEEFAQRQPFVVERIVIDDCSESATQQVLAAWHDHDASLRIARNDRNRGKGFSVARGMSLAHGHYRVFLDADLAYPATEISKIVAALERGADVAIAARTHPDSRYVMSPAFFHYLYTRHLMSRIFNWMVRLILLPGIRDTQAGLKGFTARAADEIFPQLSIPRFGFDLECLFIARRRGLVIDQTPVNFRYDNEPSTVHFVRDVVAMLRDIATVRWRGWRGRYG